MKKQLGLGILAICTGLTTAGVGFAAENIEVETQALVLQRKILRLKRKRWLVLRGQKHRWQLVTLTRKRRAKQIRTPQRI